jgi:5'-deoxynucleotidase YfbR-like HD superfamily hydrolase
MVPVEHKIQALMHDASEAYLLDIPRPIKHRLPAYKEIERNLMLVIAQKFGFSWPISDETHKADETMLQFEWDNMMLQSQSGWDPHRAEIKFLNQFNAYYHEQTTI